MITKTNTVVSKELETTYTGYDFTIGKTLWGVTVNRGRDNSIRVRKISNNPWLTMGNEYESFDEAVAKYKNPTMKLNLRLIELNF